MKPETIKQMTDSIFEAVRGYVDRLMEKRISALPIPKDGEKGERGEAGKDGLDGKDGAPGRDGVDGKDATVDFEALARAAAALIPPPKDGADGQRGEKGDAGERGEAATVDLEALAKSAAALIPIPKDGEPGKDGRDGVDGTNGTKGEPGEKGDPGEQGRDGRDGLEGAPGRDAAHLEILPSIDPAKSYPRSIYARHAGGLWRSFETTDGMKGWECIVEGIAGFTLSQSDEDPRAFSFEVRTSGGAVQAKSFRIPSLIYKRVWQEGEYESGDMVTWAGSVWHCTEPTKEKPGDGATGWQLAVKRGDKGESNYGVARRNGFAGTEAEWLESLRPKMAQPVILPSAK